MNGSDVIMEDGPKKCHTDGTTDEKTLAACGLDSIPSDKVLKWLN